jgi:hypothetical protein
MIITALPSMLHGQTYVDIAGDHGVNYQYGACLLGGGISFTDFNGDGLDDLMMPSCQGEPIHLFVNTGDSFSPFVAPVLDLDTLSSKGIYAVDLDNDGDRELFVTNIDGQNRLYRNDGDSYTDITDAAGISDNNFDSYSATFGDIDQDGLLDFYVGNRSIIGEPMQNFLYRNLGDLTFENLALTAGVTNSLGATLAVGFVDIDNDLLPDLYLANDKHTGNRLFKNLGGGSFEDISITAACYYEMDGMSVSLCDFDKNDYLDIYVTNTLSGNLFLKNLFGESFADIAESEGLTINQMTWGAVFYDFDNDGDEDLYVAASGPPTDIANNFFEFDFESFTESTEQIIPVNERASFGAAIGDYNLDGFYDLAVLSGSAEGSELLLNTPNSNNYIAITLEGVVSNREAVGSWIRVYAEDQIYSDYVTLGSNFAGQDSHRRIIGIGSNNVVDSVVVTFPSGIVNELTGPAINTTHHIIESIPITVISTNDNPLKVYPNPARDYIIISAESAGEQNLLITDLNGRLVKELSSLQFKESNGKIDISDLQPGIYTLRFSQNVTSSKFTVVR